MLTRYKMTMAYDGHLFHGFQLQPDQRTVQGASLCKDLVELMQGLMQLDK